jgi:hypothetical protein
MCVFYWVEVILKFRVVYEELGFVGEEGHKTGEWGKSYRWFMVELKSVLGTGRDGLEISTREIAYAS